MVRFKNKITPKAGHTESISHENICILQIGYHWNNLRLADWLQRAALPKMWTGYLRTRRKKGRSWSFQCIIMRITKIAAMWHSSWETWAKVHSLSDIQPTKSKVMILPRSNLVNQCIYGVTYVTVGEGLLMWTGRLKDNCVSKSPPKKKKMEPWSSLHTLKGALRSESLFQAASFACLLPQ